MVSFHRLWMCCLCLLPMPVWALCGSAGVCPVAPDVPDNAVDEDGDGIKLYTVHLDPTGDTNFGATNDLTRVAMGWNETALVFEYEYRLQSNAIVWYFELGIPGGEDNFMFNSAFPTNVYHDRFIDLMVGTYGTNPQYIYYVSDTTSTDITQAITNQGGVSCRTNVCDDGRTGVGYVRVTWDALYHLGPGAVPVGAVLSVAGIIRAQDNSTPAEVVPGDRMDISTELTQYIELELDKNEDGLLDLGYLMDADTDGFTPYSGDCNDADGTIYPGATEQCNARDEDCDGLIDEGAKTTFYADNDDDGYGNALVMTQACAAPSGYVSQSGDCNDAQSDVYPGATEQCNDRDDDCDGAVDEPLSEVCPITPVPETPTQVPVTPTQVPVTPTQIPVTPTQIPVTPTHEPTPPLGTPTLDPTPSVTPPGSPTSAPTHTPAPVTATPDITPDITTPDAFTPSLPPNLSPEPSTTPAEDTDLDGISVAAGDCDDANGSIFPGAVERCDQADNDCDGAVDEGVVMMSNGQCLTEPGFGCSCQLTAPPATVRSAQVRASMQGNLYAAWPVMLGATVSLLLFSRRRRFPTPPPQAYRP